MPMNLGLDMDDERLQKMLAAYLRGEGMSMESQVDEIANSPMPSGMMSGYVDKAVEGEKRRALEARSQDFTGREGQIKSQRDYANSLRGRPSPKGRTAGPYDVYYAPNIGESLEYALNQGVGGYLAGKANDADTALDEDRTALKAAVAAEEAGRYETGIEMKQDLFNETVRGNRRSEDLSTEKIQAMLKAKKIREYTEFTDGETPLRGYTEEGIAYDDKGQLLPENYSEVQKVTGQSSIPYQAITAEDEYGNTIITSYNKGTEEIGASRFIDGSPYSKEKAKIRAERTAEQAGNVEGAKGKAKSLVEQYGEAANGLMANNAAIGQYKIALHALKKGAQSGPIADIFPTFRGESIKLKNARDSQALTQIAQYTFGSLSQAEGDWLKDTSMPLGLEEEDLTNWLNKRVEGFERANKAESYRLDMINAGHQPDPRVEAAIKYEGGFTWD